ncbi:hypothetical protein BH23GEM11_BH23GEM11_08660 [soil metagenome]
MKMRTWIFRMPARFNARLGRGGQALAETAIIMPVLLLMIVGIIEMSSAWRTYQVLTNAAREGARVALLPTATLAEVTARVNASVRAGGLDPEGPNFSFTAECLNGETVIAPVCGESSTGTDARISVAFDYTFRLLQPVANLACGGGCGSFGTITIGSSSIMRNE